MGRADLSQMCNVLNTLGNVEWRVNKKILETIEYVWSIGGGIGDIPKRYNERIVTAEMMKDATF